LRIDARDRDRAGDARVRPPPNAELVRRACERRRAGESLASVARDAGVTAGTVRRWMAAYGDAPVAPPIMREAAPAPPEAVVAELPAALEALATRLAPADARLVRRAIDAIAAPRSADVDMPDPATDTRGWIVAMIARAQRSYDAAERSHNATAAKQWGATLERWSKTLAQHDRAHVDDDVVAFPAAELAAKTAALAETLRVLGAEPLRCVDCGRRVRVSWAEADE